MSSTADLTAFMRAAPSEGERTFHELAAPPDADREPAPGRSETRL
jgi:hypothetical protein